MIAPWITFCMGAALVGMCLKWLLYGNQVKTAIHCKVYQSKRLTRLKHGNAKLRRAKIGEGQKKACKNHGRVRVQLSS
jgi:hypothetical protein